jgi:ribosomal protein L17
MKLFNSSRVLNLGMTLVLAGFGSSAFGAADEETAKTLTTIFRSARAVVADNIKSMQTNPKDAGLDMAGAQKAVDKKYLAATGGKIDTANDAAKSLKDSIDAVFTKSFADGFKETWAASKHYPNKLLPARFAREIGQKLKETSGGKYEIRLTVIDECLVNPENKADEWEQKMMKEKIGTKGWEKNKGFFEVQADKKQARYILPEYYDSNCLNCHGAAKGKELHPNCPNTELGSFGGAISVIMKM